MRSLPQGLGLIHFVGIGGIGMSGIAEVLHNLGYKVQGSDVADGANTRRLAALGIAVTVGHRAENLGAAEVVVVSSAIKPDNPEIVAKLRYAAHSGRPARRDAGRADAPSLGDRGRRHPRQDHHHLDDRRAARSRPARPDGDQRRDHQRLRHQHASWAKATGWWSRPTRATGTFTRLPAAIAVVTNIDPEHLDHYGDFAAWQQAFEAFAGNIPFYGFAVLCIDHPVVQGLIPKLAERRVRTYGFSPQADVRAVNIRLGAEGSAYDAIVADRATAKTRTIRKLFLPMFGEHIVLNSLAAIAVAAEMGLGDAVVRASFKNFKGVRRRFHQDRRMERSRHHRRIRPPPGRDRRGFEGGAVDHRRQGHRRRAAAPLHPARRFV